MYDNNEFTVRDRVVNCVKRRVARPLAVENQHRSTCHLLRLERPLSSECCSFVVCRCIFHIDVLDDLVGTVAHSDSAGW